MTTTRRLLVAALLGAAAFAGQAAAQAFPTQQITMVIPFAPGGPTDVVGRLLAEVMGRDLGQPVVVQNVGGAGGTIGVHRVVQARPDGHTILYTNIGIATQPTLYRRLPYNPLTDLEPFGLVTPTPMIISVRPNFPGTTLADFLAYARERRDGVNLANAGLGSASQLCGTLLQAQLGINFTTVSFTGSGPIFPQLIAGNLDVYCDQTTSSLPFVREGRIRGLAMATRERLPQAPDIPTTAEAGLPGFEVSIWHGMYAPRGTPRPVIERLNRALRVAIQDPTVVARLNDLASPPEPLERVTPEAHRAFLEAEINRWRPVLQAAGQYAD
ncbi:MAG: tripartite tricarboxylate transporter substrate-binding protein [Acetobacteraceae bacterium]|nr:tripartite tricarboxylate transporter substrate-binding protein [Acetobacteraceae bacterium]MCX7684269.1 tripartite tricarboxylate transporter substrate-binding protein [Acetobacteraceae bacterium]MDW8397464.1 tripartite tricarboxylate transporter substrate-binding protein [Acetobacteraceae bacterium]